MSRDISVITWGVRVATSSEQRLTMLRNLLQWAGQLSPTTQTYPAQNVSSGKGEKRCTRGMKRNELGRNTHNAHMHVLKHLPATSESRVLNPACPHLLLRLPIRFQITFLPVPHNNSRPAVFLTSTSTANFRSFLR